MLVKGATGNRHHDDWRISMDWWSSQELGSIMSSRTMMVPTLQILTTSKVFHWLKPLFTLYNELFLMISLEDKDLSLSKEVTKLSGICTHTLTYIWMNNSITQIHAVSVNRILWVYSGFWWCHAILVVQLQDSGGAFWAISDRGINILGFSVENVMTEGLSRVCSW